MSKLKIAVDARPLNHPCSGIGRFTVELLATLVDSEYEWHLFYTPRVQHDFLKHKNVFVHSLGHSNLFDFIKLNFLSFNRFKKLGINTFWSPRHHLPVVLPKGIKTVLTIHDLVWMHVPETMTRLGFWQEKLLMGYSIKRANFITTVSKSTQHDLLKVFQIEPEDVEIITPGLSELFHQPNEESQSGKLEELPKGFALFVGAMQPRKNLKRLLVAYSKLSNHDKIKVPLVIAGAGEWGGESVQAIVASLHISQHVTILRDVSDEALLCLYGRAIFLVMPSLYEGFGMPIIEAFSRGVPVLTSKNSSMIEVGNSHACYVDPYNVESIASGLSKMINDDAYRKKLAEGIQPYATQYSWRNSAKKLLNCFEQS